MALSPEALYMQLGRLIAEMPDLVSSADATPEKQRWLGRAVALVETQHDVSDIVELKRAVGLTRFEEKETRQVYADVITEILYRALERAGVQAPASVQGAFVPAGNVLDAFSMVGKILGEAKADVLLVDPYTNEKITDFAVTAPESTTVRILTTEQYSAALNAAAERWVQQYSKTRRLEIRVLDRKLLHDRLIIIDGTTAWSLPQSFKDLAVRSPTTIVRTPADIATAKIEAYSALWEAAMPLQ